MRSIRAADLFCGAGGTSTGLALAAEELGLKVDLLAINHWDVAIETHEANHPWARHLCKSIHEVDPRKVIPSGRLHILVASPECTHHSIARGGRPISDQMRMSAWQIVDWLSALQVDNVIIENVREFRSWGPLDSRGRPLKSRKGETYRAFVDAIRSLGYNVEEQLLNAADFGDPTTRVRLFIVGRRGKKPITWPQPSHYPTELLGPKWVPARKIIDWSLRGESIFGRKRPLASNTMARIYAGLKKYGGLNLNEPYIVSLRGTDPGQVKHSSRSVEQPVPTVAAGGNHLGVVQPFLLPHRMFDGMQVDSVERPLRTIVGKNGGDIGLVQPFIVPFFGERDGQTPRTHSIDEPLPAPTSHGAGGLVEPFLVHVNHGSTHGRGNSGRTRSVNQPTPAITTTRGIGLVEAFLLKYHGTGGPRSVEDPLDTITTKDRFALVELEGEPYVLDIRFRMLQPHELARAMGFPAEYRFAGTRADQVRQIGNAVAVRTARALCRSVLEAA